MHSLKNKSIKTGILFLGILLLNFIQAMVTPIIGDEAYYWTYSQNLAWGYFDHPPMVALLIKFSSSLFSGNTGIRFMTVILSVLTSLLIWHLIPEENKHGKNSKLIFFIILLAIPGFHLYGFITTPDVPLLFFFTLYLHVFEKFYRDNNLKYALLLGIAAALLIYSKYHGGIFILLSVILRFHLLKKWTIYFAGFIALLLLLPHLYWQYQHDFITFEYHLFERTEGVFDIQNMGNYLVGSMGILNPVWVILAIVYSLKNKAQISFYQKLFFGIIIFFSLYALKNKVEAHWVVAALIPLVLVLHEFAITSHKKLKTIKNVGLVFLIILLTARIIINFPTPFTREFSSENKSYFDSISKEAKEKKVVFVNSYQKASKYKFYTHLPAFSYNTEWYRKNQYDIENYENEYHNQSIYMVGDSPAPYLDSITLDNGSAITAGVINRFPLFTKLKLDIDSDVSRIMGDQQQDLNLTLENPYTYPLDFKTPDMPFEMKLLFRHKDKRFYAWIKDSINTLPPESLTKTTVNFSPDQIPAGKYNMWVLMSAGGLYFQIVSQKYSVQVQ